jgi:hypothetical protein
LATARRPYDPDSELRALDDEGREPIDVCAVTVEAAALLRAAGFDATTVLDQKLGGHPDSAVASMCKLEGRTLVTLDLDFSNIDAYPPRRLRWPRRLRLSRQDKDSVLHLLQALVPRLVGATLAGRLWIVEETRVRERVQSLRTNGQAAPFFPGGAGAPRSRPEELKSSSTSP